jgi:hypothetical protein
MIDSTNFPMPIDAKKLDQLRRSIGSNKGSHPRHMQAGLPPMSARRLMVQMFRLSCWVAGFIGIGCGIYMTLRPSSVLSEIPWLPTGLARWADSYGRFRNFPAYAALAVPFMFVCNGRRPRAKAIAWLAVFGAVVEGLQYWLPTRWCEWQDVAWSWVGLAATWLATEIGFWVAWEIRCEFKHGEPVGTARRSRRQMKAARK